MLERFVKPREAAGSGDSSDGSPPRIEHPWDMLEQVQSKEAPQWIRFGCDRGVGVRWSLAPLASHPLSPVGCKEGPPLDLLRHVPWMLDGIGIWGIGCQVEAERFLSCSLGLS